MTTFEWTITALAACILFLVATVSVSILRPRNHSSTRRSPTPTSTPSTPSVDPTTELMTRMLTTMETQATENRRLLEIMMVGREPSPTPEDLPTFSRPQPMEYDYDSTPLSPGIEAVIAREVEEDQLAVLMRERIALQERMREIQADQERLTTQSTLDDSSPGPWHIPEADIPT